MEGLTAKIEVTGGQGVGETYEIVDDVTVGRDDHNAITLRDPGASRHHARVYRSGECYMVEDLQSRNGTAVNGAMITQETLKDGDVIQIGSHKLRFSMLEQDGLESIDDFGEQSIVQKSMDVASYDPAQQLLQSGSAEESHRLYRHMRALHDLGKDIGTILRLEELLGKVLDHVFETFAKTDKGFILLKDDPDAGKLVLRASKARREGAQTGLTVSNTLIQEVMRSGRAILSSDAQNEFDGLASIVEHRIRSMACVPLVCQGQTLGVLHVHSTGGRGVFEEEDLNLLTSIGNQAAICVKNAQLYAEVEHETSLRRDFQRYVSPGVAEQIVQKKITVELGGQYRTGTVFFSDIVGFTALSEIREPSDVVLLLNQYFRLMVDVIFRYEGTVNKFGGDAIFAVWGAPLDTEDDEFKAVAAGIGMQNAMFRLNLQLVSRQQEQLGMGIGVNSGRFMAGNIGSDDRMEYTIIGDVVNLASRIEAKATRGQVLVSEATYKAVADRVIAVQLPPTHVKGRTEPVVIHSIRGVTSSGWGVSRAVELAIPVTYSTKRRQGVQAMLTNASPRPEGGFSLDLICHQPLPKSGTVHLQPQLKELPDLPAFECRIAEGAGLPAIETTDFSLANVVLDHADERMLALLQPGQILKSPLESIDGLRESTRPQDVDAS